MKKCYDYIDVYQVGTQNSQNFNLLDALGRVDKPVMIKRYVRQHRKLCGVLPDMYFLMATRNFCCVKEEYGPMKNFIEIPWI